VKRFSTFYRLLLCSSSTFNFEVGRLCIVRRATKPVFSTSSSKTVAAVTAHTRSTWRRSVDRNRLVTSPIPLKVSLIWTQRTCLKALSSIDRIQNFTTSLKKFVSLMKTDTMCIEDCRKLLCNEFIDLQTTSCKVFPVSFLNLSYLDTFSNTCGRVHLVQAGKRIGLRAAKI